MTELITSFMELISLLILTSGFISHKFFDIRKIHFFIVFIFFKAIYVYLFNFINDEFISFAYNMILLLFIIKSYYALNFNNTIYTFLCGYVFLVLLELPFIILDACLIKITHPNVAAISCMIYTIIAAIIVNKLLPTYKLYNLIFNNNKLGILLIANVFALFVITTMYFKIDRARFVDMIIFFAVTIIILTSINIVALNQFNIIRKQRKQLDAYEEYFPMIESLITTVRRRQHHHSNEIQAILSLMYNNKDYDSLVNAINEQLELSGRLDMPAYLLKLNMKMIAGFLYMKEQEAAKHNKFLLIEVETFELKSKVPEYILIELFGILIDNALEAISCGESVYVNIDSRDEKIIFKTKNKGYKLLSEHRTKFFTSGYSTKNTSMFSKQHTGLGLPTLRNIVIEQYKGQILADNEGPNNDIIFQICI